MCFYYIFNIWNCLKVCLHYWSHQSYDISYIRFVLWARSPIFCLRIEVICESKLYRIIHSFIHQLSSTRVAFTLHHSLSLDGPAVYVSIRYACSPINHPDHVIMLSLSQSLLETAPICVLALTSNNILI